MQLKKHILATFANARLTYDTNKQTMNLVCSICKYGSDLDIYKQLDSKSFINSLDTLQKML